VPEIDNRNEQSSVVVGKITNDQNVAIKAAITKARQQRAEAGTEKGKTLDDFTGPVIVSGGTCSHDQCKAAEGIPLNQNAAPDWKRTPLTISLLIALLLGGGWIVNAMSTLSDRLDQDRSKAITAHGHDERAHPGIRTEISKLRTEVSNQSRNIGKLDKNIDILRSEVRAALSQSSKRGRK
jgi:hypothetical protein